MSTRERATAGQKGSILSTIAGGLSILALCEAITGVVLAFRYSANPALAHGTAAEMHRGALRVAQSFHYWGSALLIAGSFVLLMAWIAMGRFRSRDRIAFLSAAILFGTSLGLQVTGNLLPYDIHGVQTAMVEVGIAHSMPFVGGIVSQAMVGGGDSALPDLGRWFAVHQWFLPLPLVLAALALAISVGLPNLRNRLLRPKTPDLGDEPHLISWRLAALLPIAVAILCAVVPSPLGTGQSSADPGYGAKVSWYTAPMHGALVMFERLASGFGWIGATLFPTALAILVVWLLLRGERVSLKAARVSLFVFLAFAVIGPLLFVDGVAPLVGTRDPAARAIVARPSNDVQDQALAAKGRAAFNSLPCQGCHGQNGSNGKGGPSLQRVFEQHPEAGFYVNYIKNPRSVDSGSTMPAFSNLTLDQRRAIAEYLRFPH